MKRTYNVDENRVVVAGVSDGGTGAYYVAMRDTTPYASFLPLNGFIMILANPSVGIREQLFPNNLRNKPFFVVNGGRDQLYPTRARRSVRPAPAGRAEWSSTYHPQPERAHNTAWWPEVKDTFEQFVRDHPRDPYPGEAHLGSGRSRCARPGRSRGRTGFESIVSGRGPPKSRCPT